MKSIIASIHPDWLREIKSGEKTIEVRKSAPREPVKYIFWHISGQKGIAGYSILEDVLRLPLCENDWWEKKLRYEGMFEDYTKVSYENLKIYAGKKGVVYLWHLYQPCKCKGKYFEEEEVYNPIPTEIYHPAQEITYKRPPQSWQYCDTPEGM